jgi:hypothetical protein
MKKISATISLVSLIAVSTAFAIDTNEFIPSELLEATNVALKNLTEIKPEHVEHITGFKTWKSGTDAKVKIYVAHDNMTMDYNYLCGKQENKIQCTTN